MNHCPHCGAPCTAAAEAFACPVCGEMITPDSAQIRIRTYETTALPAHTAIRRMTHNAVRDSLTFAPCGEGWSVTGCRTGDAHVAIPSEYRGKAVIAVGERAFAGAIVERVTLPPTLRTLGREAFARCRMLTEVTGGDNLEDIAEGCFRNCIRLERLNITSVPAADISAFAGCYALGLANENVHYRRDR